MASFSSKSRDSESSVSSNSNEHHDSSDQNDLLEQPSGFNNRQQKIVLVSCLTSQLLSNVCASLPAPFLPSLNEGHNIGSDITGFVLGLLPLTQFFVCPLYARLVHHMAVKTMLVTGLFVCGGFTILFGLLDYFPAPDVTDDGPDVLFIVMEITLRILQSLGSGAISVSALTLLTITFTENTTTILGYSQTVIGLGYMCGPALGSGLYKAGGFATVFCVIGAVIALLSPLVIFLLPNDARARADNETQTPLRQILTKTVVLVLILTVFIGTLWSSISPIIEPELRDKFGLTEDVSALTFLIASLTFTIASISFGKALDNLSCLNARYLMIAGFIVNAINFLFLGPTPLIPAISRPLWMLLVCLGVLGFSNAMVVMPTFDLLSFNGPDGVSGENGGSSKSKKAMLSALWTSSYAFGDFLGPTFSGVMAAKTNFAWTMTSYAFGCMFVTVLLVAAQVISFIIRLGNKNRVQNEETIPLIT